MSAIGYLRVSTDEQAQDGVSLGAQRAKIEMWAELNDRNLVGVFEDAGVSGASLRHRPGLLEALDTACRTKGALIVYSLSRLARSTKDTLQISERLARAGAELVSLTERIDTTSAAGKMVFRMLAVLAEFERDQVSERTRAAMSHLRRSRKRISRHVPYGWDVSPDGKTLIENATEQEALRLMRQLRESGLSYRRIAEELDVRAIPTKQGAQSWSPKVVRSILKRVDEK